MFFKQTTPNSVLVPAAICVSLFFILVTILFYQLNTINTQQADIQKIQNDIYYFLENQNQTTQSCVVDQDAWAVLQNSYCDAGIPIINYSTSTEVYIDWVPDLQTKIDNGYVVYEAICVHNLIVQYLYNNPNTSFPVPASSSNDMFTMGLPNLCVPGSNIGHSGFSSQLQAVVDDFILFDNYTSDIPLLRTVIHYDNNTIPANIGASFYMANNFTKCYTVELHCYGFNALYSYFINK
jgi:hypothetical protein